MTNSWEREHRLEIQHFLDLSRTGAFDDLEVVSRSVIDMAYLF